MNTLNKISYKMRILQYVVYVLYIVLKVTMTRVLGVRTTARFTVSSLMSAP